MKGAWKLEQAATAWDCVRASRDALPVRCSVSGDESLPRQPGGRGAWLTLAAHRGGRHRSAVASAEEL